MTASAGPGRRDRPPRAASGAATGSPLRAERQEDVLPRLGRITQETLGTTVMEALRASILHGQFSTGERLVEATIAQEMGISRGPLREALARLEQDGLIQGSPRRGKYVVQLTTQSIDEHYRLRLVLETYAVGRVVEVATRATDRRLETAWKGIRKAVEAGDERQLALADVAFHDTMYQVTGDDLLARVWAELLAGRLRLLVNDEVLVHGPMNEELVNHRLILDAILARDVEAARAEVTRHIEDGWARMRALGEDREKRQAGDRGGSA